MFPNGKFQQIAYVVDDVRRAAADHAAMFGSGPFFVLENVAAPEAVYRGTPVAFVSSVALGQHGDVMIELLASAGTGPDMLNDLYPAGGRAIGVHHLCYFVDSFALTLQAMEQRFDTVLRTTLAGGTRVAISDTSAVCGHFTEFHERTGEIRDLYGFVRDAARDFDGRDPVREMSRNLMPA